MLQKLFLSLPHLMPLHPATISSSVCISTPSNRTLDPRWARRTVLWPTLRCDFCPPTPVFMVWAPEGWHISSSGSHCFAFIIAACGGVISGWWWRLWDCLSVGLLWCYKRSKVWLNTHFTALDGVKEFGCSYWLDVEGKLLVYWEINSAVIGGFLKALRRTLYIKWTWYLWHVS